MSPEPKKQDIETIRSLCVGFGIPLSWDQGRQLGIFLDALVAWNQKINLTGLPSRQRIINELLIDSMMPTPFMPDEGRLLDVGSGGGFPAIPMKICKPRLECHLVEPRSKKTSFLKQVIRLTGLRKIEVIRGRVEKGGGLLHPKGYDVVTSRGLAPLPQTLTMCAPHLKPGGMIVTFLGNRYQDSIQERGALIREHRLLDFKSIPYVLPGKKSERNILILKKRGGHGGRASGLDREF